MDSYVHMIGNYKVFDKQKAKENVYKLLYEGGMMALSQVILFDKEIVLQKPCCENAKYFSLNYFEDNIMEIGTVNENGMIQYSKTGERQFLKVLCAVYLYMELISEEPCIAILDGKLIDSNAIGWINHVLGTNYTVYDRYQNLWDKLMLTKNRQNLYSDIIKDINMFNAINTSIYRDIMAYLYLYQNDILQEAEKGLEKNEEASNIDDTQKTVQLSGLVNIVQNAITKYKADHSYEDLIHFPFDEKENKRDDIEIGMRFFRFIPPQIYASLVAKEMDMSFDEVWNDIKERENEYPYICQIDDSDQKTLYTQTSEYLNLPSPSNEQDIKPYTLTDDDRMYWNAKPSEEMEKWMGELQERYQNIEPKTVGIEAYMELLVKANMTFKRIYPFADMFYEFLTNLNDEHYQKALLLFDELIEENREKGEIIKNSSHSSWKYENTGITFNEGRLAIKRYLALMANAELRKKLFKF